MGQGCDPSFRIGRVTNHLGAIFISLELSQSTWLISSLAPGGGEKVSKHQLLSGDMPGLFSRFSQLQAKACRRTWKELPVIVIHEAGLDGFWIHRRLQQEGIESHVVDPASIATSRRRRQAGNASLQTTMIQLAWLWLRHQPHSALTVWFQERAAPGRSNRRVMIVALARKLLTALWKFATSGLVPEGVVLTAA